MTDMADSDDTDKINATCPASSEIKKNEPKEEVVKPNGPLGNEDASDGQKDGDHEGDILYKDMDQNTTFYKSVHLKYPNRPSRSLLPLCYTLSVGDPVFIHASDDIAALCFYEQETPLWGGYVIAISRTDNKNAFSFQVLWFENKGPSDLQLEDRTIVDELKLSYNEIGKIEQESLMGPLQLISRGGVPNSDELFTCFSCTDFPTVTEVLKDLNSRTKNITEDPFKYFTKALAIYSPEESLTVLKKLKICKENLTYSNMLPEYMLYDGDNTTGRVAKINTFFRNIVKGTSSPMLYVCGRPGTGKVSLYFIFFVLIIPFRSLTYPTHKP